MLMQCTDLQDSRVKKIQKLWLLKAKNRGKTGASFYTGLVLCSDERIYAMVQIQHCTDNVINQCLVMPLLPTLWAAGGIVISGIHPSVHTCLGGCIFRPAHC